MSTSANDPLAGWDPRRRAALERGRAEFKAAGAGKTLVDELIVERRLAAAAENGIDPSDPESFYHHQAMKQSRATSDRP